jgi:hypothetical protein
MRNSGAGFSPVGCGRGRDAVRSFDGESPRPTQPATTTHIATTDCRIFLPPTIVHPFVVGTAPTSREREAALYKRNPKIEIRNPKEIPNQNPEIQNSRTRGFEFRYFDLRFLSDFGL